MPAPDRAENYTVARCRWAVVSVAALLLSGCAHHRDRVSGLVPTPWTLTASSGHIAAPCFGSWEECGTLMRTYSTHSAVQPAVESIAHRLQASGWTVERVDHGEVEAFNARDLKSETARLTVDVSDGLASLRYVHE